MNRLFENRAADDPRRTVDNEHARRSRVVLYMLVMMTLVLATSVGTLGMLMWDQALRFHIREAEAKESEVTRCMIVYALGIQEKGDYKFCDQYRDWIEKNTNIRAPERRQ